MQQLSEESQESNCGNGEGRGALRKEGVLWGDARGARNEGDRATLNREKVRAEI